MKYTALKILSTLTLTFTLVGTANAELVERLDDEITSVDFEIIDNRYGNIAEYGKFSGVDNNFDGFLAFNELSMFIGYSVENGSYDLSHLLDMGDFDIVNDTWLSNARSYSGRDNLWIKYSQCVACLNENNSIYWTVKTNSESTSVPEPPMLLLIGTVFAGLAGMKRRRSRCSFLC